MSSFAALMALSATQTRQAEAAVQSALAERQRKEAQKRKAQEEKEAKEREMEKKLRIKYLEEAKREEERQRRREEEKRQKEETLKKKEEEQRDALRYGPKRSKPEYPSASAVPRRVGMSDDEDGSGGGSVLTREEKRQQRLQRELNYGLNGARRSTAGNYKKAGRRLPGGAVDATASSNTNTPGAYRSVKDRLAHEPPGLIKLNVNKRDTRTIDEIMQDRARMKAAKSLSGEDAKSFDNWFGSKPKAKPVVGAEVSRASSMFSSRSNSPDRLDRKLSAESHLRNSKSMSSTPPAQSKSVSSKPASSLGSQATSSSRPAFGSQPKGSGVQIKSVGKALDKSLPSHLANKPATKAKLAKSSSASASRTPASKAATSKLSSSTMKKRARSPSLSDSPPPPKRRPASNSISAEIWKMFGKDRNAYVARDVFSDDEDMEAGAADLESEEMYSARIARREDELAAEEERRHEEEKRRRRKEKEMRERQRV